MGEKNNKTNQKQIRSKFYFDWTDRSSGIFFGIKNVIASKQTPYQLVEIIELEEVGLSLIIDGKIQIAELDEFIYHEVIVHIPFMAFGDPEKVLVVGGGDGCAIREALKWKSVKKCVLVDIDREVVEMSREFLNHINRGAFFDPRVMIFYDDGRNFVENTNEKFDVIIIDTVDPLEFGPSYMLFTKEFLESVKEKLSDGGVVAIQSNTIFPGGSRFLHAMYRTLELVFPKISLASAYLKSFMLKWAFTIGCKGRAPEEVPDNELKEKLARIETRYLTPEVFRASLAKPKYFLEDIEKFKGIITDDKPIFVV